MHGDTLHVVMIKLNSEYILWSRGRLVWVTALCDNSQYTKAELMQMVRYSIVIFGYVIDKCVSTRMVYEAVGIGYDTVVRSAAGW